MCLPELAQQQLVRLRTLLLIPRVLLVLALLVRVRVLEQKQQLHVLPISVPLSLLGLMFVRLAEPELLMMKVFVRHQQLRVRPTFVP